MTLPNSVAHILSALTCDKKILFKAFSSCFPLLVLIINNEAGVSEHVYPGSVGPEFPTTCWELGVGGGGSKHHRLLSGLLFVTEKNKCC